MSAVSQNGWPVSPNEADLDVTPLVVGGVQFSPGVRAGKVHDLLSYVAHAVHTRVQKANSTYGCWGYSFRENVNSPGEWSNHASATAIDFNASLHGNGVPTIESWSQAQIDEIHKILDEVDNVVRWGGDYEGTPDAMHFEINVPPDQLDVAIPEVPKASSVWPTGVRYIDLDNLESMPELTEMSVSYPTHMAYVHGQAGWVFRPTRSGQISIDALLSHHTDPDYWSSAGPHVYLDIYEVNRDYSWPGRFVTSTDYFPGGFGYPERNQGRILFDVEAGKEYLLYTVASQSMPYIRTVVRIGDYAEEPEWEQPDPLPPREWLANTNNPNNSYLVKGGGNFRGGDMDIYRAFGGPLNPIFYSDARECAWRWARRMWSNTGVTWWSPDNGGVWNGGPGVCPVITGKLDMHSEGGASGQVGYSFTSGTTFGDFTWYVWGTSFALAPKDIPYYETSWNGGNPSGGTWPPPWWPEYGPNEWVETEPGGFKLISMDVRWNRWSSVSQPRDDGSIVKWYMGEFEGGLDETGLDYVDHPVGKWGPWGQGSWYGQSGDSPENWAASQTHMGDSSGNDIGTWHSIPQEYIDEASGDPANPYDPRPIRLRFTCLPVSMLVDTPPSLPAIVDGMDYDNYHNGLTIEIRSVVQPPRFRVHRDPGIEDLAWAGVAAIAMRPEDAGQVFYDKGVTPVQHGI